jgi:diguanylate cyclase (GGDEF)-like protein
MTRWCYRPAGIGSWSVAYVRVALFAALYFRLFAVLAHVGGIGAAYAVALALGPEAANPVAAWMAVFGTVAVAAAVLLAVVSVLRSAAHTDPLTGLANRRSWDERFDEELERSRRTGQGLSVAMIDLDGFKAVNDRDGHEAGDRVLEELASAWQAVVRSGGDFLARLGGDEFGLLAPGSDATGIRRLIKRLGEVLPAGVVASIGVATWDGTENASDLLRRADQAMYETKLRHRREEGRRPA